MEKRLRGLLDQAASQHSRNQGRQIVRRWQAKAWTLLILCILACLLSIYYLWRPWRFLAMAGIAAVFAFGMYLLVRGYNRLIVSLVCDQCDPSLALGVMREADRGPLLGLFVNRNVETVAAVLNCMMLEGREDEARQAMKELELHSRAWDYRRTVLLCDYHFMKKDSMEIDKEYGALGKFAAAGYRDARQNFKWMHDMQRMTELEDFYDYTREPEKKQKYREELTALLEEKIRMSHNKAQRLQMKFRLAQIEFKEEEYDRAARLLEEIAREGNTLGVAGQAQQMLSRLYR